VIKHGHRRSTFSGMAADGLTKELTQKKHNMFLTMMGIVERWVDLTAVVENRVVCSVGIEALL
jgi:hypothetical protein